MAARAATMAATGSLYETLYASHGYHANMNLTVGSTVGHVVVDSLKPYVAERGVLDVGCSHGKVVQMLWEGGVRASGVDVSPTAVRMARQRLDHTARRCADEACFQAAPATSLPFKNGTFDAIVSSDMLEHLLPPEVPLMAAEFSRVARRLLLLQIALAAEVNKRPVQSLHNRSASAFADVTTLHTTLLGAPQWAAAFTSHGWRVKGAYISLVPRSKWLLLLLTRRAAPASADAQLMEALTRLPVKVDLPSASWSRIDNGASAVRFEKDVELAGLRLGYDLSYMVAAAASRAAFAKAHPPAQYDPAARHAARAPSAKTMWTWWASWWPTW